MLRLGPHYIEPRRLGYFAFEGAALALAFALFSSVAARALGVRPALGTLALHAAAATAFVSAALSLGDLHDLKVALDDAVEGRRLFRVLGGALLGSALLLWLGRVGGAATAMIVAGLCGGSLALLATRLLLPLMGRRFGLRTRIFLVGEGVAAHRLLREITRDGRVEVAGFCGPRATEVAEKARAAGARVVVVAADERRGATVEELLRCRTQGIDVCSAAVFATRALQRLPVDQIRPADLVYADGFAPSAVVLLLRRVLSVSVSLVLLVLTSPLFLVAAIAIRLDSSGPVLFRQMRTGRGGRAFEMIKLRTMTVDAERAGAEWAKAADPRVTRVGRVLRRYRLDELPQLINVLRGQMELIGPRPERPEFVARLRLAIPFYDLRHLVPPGITGWAQVRYPYAATVEEAREKLQYDLYYVRHLSLSLDLYVCLLTARTILQGRGAR